MVLVNVQLGAGWKNSTGVGTELFVGSVSSSSVLGSKPSCEISVTSPPEGVAAFAVAELFTNSVVPGVTVNLIQIVPTWPIANS